LMVEMGALLHGDGQPGAGGDALLARVAVHAVRGIEIGELVVEDRLAKQGDVAGRVGEREGIKAVRVGDSAGGEPGATAVVKERFAEDGGVHFEDAGREKMAAVDFAAELIGDARAE
jgi:hypothetical protein